MTLLLALVLSFELTSTESPPTGSERVVFRTTAGDIVVALYPQIAPQHAAQMLELARLGAYDTVDFFRVVPGFIVQTSEVEYRRLPLTAAQQKAIRSLPLELSRFAHRRGMLSMARQEDDPDSARTSFSILLGDAPHLDGSYTVFGHVEGGLDVLDEMARVRRDENDRPLERIEILRTEVVPSVEALDGIYLAGPKPIGAGSNPLESARVRQLVLGAVLVMMLLSLASFALSGRVSPKVLASLSLLVTLVGGFVLFVYFAPGTEPNHLHGVVALLAILATLKLMGKFEHPG